MIIGKQPSKLLINRTKPMSEDTNDVVLEEEVKVEEPSNLDELDIDALKELAIKSQKDIQTLNAQRKHFKEKYQKLVDQPKEKPVEQPVTNQSAPNQFSREEIILLTKGLDEDDLKQLKVLTEGAKAVGETISLTQALENPMYLAYKKQREEEAKSKKASLSPSGSSSSSKKSEDVSKMTREQHEEYARKKVMGK